VLLDDAVLDVDNSAMTTHSALIQIATTVPTAVAKVNQLEYHATAHVPLTVNAPVVPVHADRVSNTSAVLHVHPRV